MKRYKQLTFASIIALLGLVFTIPLASSAHAINVFSGACGSDSTSSTDSGSTGAAGSAAGDGTDSGSGGGSASSICGAAKQDDANKIVTNVINTILVVLGMAAVIMIIIGGVRYTTSNGDSGSIKSAKDTILYAVIGLVVAIFAYAIVNFVLTNIAK